MQNKLQEQTGEKKALIQLIVFMAGNEEFGVPIEATREIIKMGQITPIPASPDYIKGIINVRGEIVTTVDVKLRFSLAEDSATTPKHIIVTKQEDGLFGLIVDEVIEVLRINPKDIQPPPSLVTLIHKKYVKGVITHHDRLIILLDLSHVLSQKELSQYTKSRENIKCYQTTIDDKKTKNKLEIQPQETNNVTLPNSEVTVQKNKGHKRRNKQ